MTYTCKFSQNMHLNELKKKLIYIHLQQTGNVKKEIRNNHKHSQRHGKFKREIQTKKFYNI